MSTTAATRIHNSPPARPCCQSKCWNRRSVTCWPCPASACRCWRSATARPPSTTSSKAAKRICRTLGRIPDNYHVLFLQGGASLQFSMVPMNLLPPGGSADYIVTGVWSEKAVKEAKRVGAVKIAAIDAGGQLQARAAAGRADARPECGLRPHHDQQHDLRHGVAPHSGDRQRAARRRRVVRHLQPADRRREVRPDLRRRPEEPRARRA